MTVPAEKLSILVPMFDEERTIAEVLARVRAVDFGMPVEVIVVDDGSRDRSAEIVERERERDPALRLVRKPNGGKGSAVRAGIAAATGTIAVVQDADLEYDPREIRAVIAPIVAGRADAVYGSRILARGRSDYTALRYYLGGRTLTALTNVLYGSKLTDEPTCYKAVRLPLLRELELACEGFEFCPELTGKLLRRGVSIEEVPISYTPRSVSEGKKIRPRDMWTAIRVLVRERVRRAPGARRRGSKALVALLAGLGALVAAEVAIRVRYGNDVSAITGATEWKTAEWEGLTYGWDLYHPTLGWTNVPGYRSGAELPFRLSIDSRGLRGARELDAAPPAGVRRVALLGDSFAFGLEVDDDETVPAQLERRLAASEVLNLGVNGYGLGQMVLRLEEQGLALAPEHVVVLVLLPIDLVRDTVDTFTHAKPAFGVEDGELVIANVPVPEASRVPWLQRHLFAAAWLWGRPRALPQPDELEDVLAVTRALLERLRRATEARGIALTVATIVGGPQIEQETWPAARVAIDAIVADVRALGLDVLDLTGLLERAWREEGPSLARPLGHWSPRGNCLIAEALAGHMVERGWTRAAGEGPCPSQ